MTIKPSLRLLSESTVKRIVCEAYDLLQDPGVRIHSDAALELLDGAGARIDKAARVAHIPSDMVGPLAEKTAKAAEMFLGYEGSRKLKRDMKKLR